MKKVNLFLLLAFVLLMANISLSSCVDDDDNDGLVSIENKLWQIPDSDFLLKFQTGDIYRYILFNDTALVIDLPDITVTGLVGSYKVGGDEKIRFTIGQEKDSAAISYCDNTKLTLEDAGGAVTFVAKNFVEFKFSKLSKASQLKFQEWYNSEYGKKDEPEDEDEDEDDDAQAN